MLVGVASMDRKMAVITSSAGPNADFVYSSVAKWISGRGSPNESFCEEIVTRLSGFGRSSTEQLMRTCRETSWNKRLRSSSPKRPSELTSWATSVVRRSGAAPTVVPKREAEGPPMLSERAIAEGFDSRSRGRPTKREHRFARRRALLLVGDLEADLDALEGPSGTGKKLLRAVREFGGYITANQSFIPNYGDWYRHGERISTGFVESTVNQVVSKRFVKTQQMRWSE